ncbi:OadG family protein [Bacteroides sp. 519]|uniref:OadG family protein n=1 Tax=Bacteroides sp. 519 TaxID=2302937 RepID=UPI0013D4ACBA|nr:OadG family protein [Bacteroides sp. 519]NDV60001.1 oxaloacetate decarboxylase [Bacteroides sp. 519]
MENFQTGLLLMVVGMVTVFAILLIVINLGKLLIFLVNKYAPEEVVAAKQKATGPAPIQPNIVAAITAAVNVVTHNKGKIVKIEKQN